MEFQSFGKIQRYEKAVCHITEKIDGTNACINIDHDGTVTTQSRNRIVTPDDDNYGFAAWVHNNIGDLQAFFGPGRHYGEWFGIGINRGYGMRERVFAPFNTGLFTQERVAADAPDGVTYTPLLATCRMSELDSHVSQVMIDLVDNGSRTREGWGWMPEGCMIWSPQFGYLKVPFDPLPKTASAQAAVAA